MIKRNLKNKIIEHLDKKEITLITGARQVGKTTLMQEIITELNKKKEKVLFLNLDIDTHAKYFLSQETLLKKIELEIGRSGYVFIDEIQRLENAGLFLKGLYDRNLAYKLVVTGSGSLALKEKIHESLAGRKRVFEMSPVSFTEFVNYKTNYKYEGKIQDFFEIEQIKTEILLLEYLNYGGYPRVITENIQSEKNLVMDEIFRSYIEKDLVYLLGIERPEVFRLLIQILASRTGSIINYSELSKNTGLALPTLKKYLWFAEKTFSITKINPFFTNPLKELVKSPCYYFIDLGFRNFASGLMGSLELPDQTGFVFQNFIFNELNDKIQLNDKLQFWRTKDKAEVDFVIKKQNNIIPVEVKFSKLLNPKMSRSFRSFIDKYQPGEAWIVNRAYKKEIILNKTKIKYFPFYELIG